MTTEPNQTRIRWHLVEGRRPLEVGTELQVRHVGGSVYLGYPGTVVLPGEPLCDNELADGQLVKVVSVSEDGTEAEVAPVSTRIEEVRMSKNDKPDLWGTDDGGVLHGDPDEAVEAELDGRDPPLPPYVTVHGWAPVGLTMKHGDILERTVEDLAGEHEWEDGDLVEPSQRMINAEKELVEAFLADYRPTLCQIVPDHEIEVNVADWVRENAPDWLEENPDLLSVTAESARGISIDHLGLPTHIRDALRRLRIYDVGQVLDNYDRLVTEEFPRIMLASISDLDPGVGPADISKLDEALKRIGVDVGHDRVEVP